MDELPTSTFGDMLRRYRIAAWLSQEVLATAVGLSLPSSCSIPSVAS
jgi:DNA-binding XRE family transcriptional regulator